MPTLYQRLPAPHLPHGTCSCTCADPAPDATTKLIVLTGGPTETEQSYGTAISTALGAPPASHDRDAEQREAVRQPQ